MRRHGRFFFPFFLVFLLACSTLSPPRIPFSDERPQGSQEFLSRLDAEVRKAGVRDASTQPVSGFPYLRTDRFLASLGKNLKNEQQREEWIRWMHQLALRSREKEIRNLPDEVILSLGSGKNGQPDREGLFACVRSWSEGLLEHDMAQSDLYETLDPLIEVPDDYSFARRAIGLYPLVSIAVIIGTKTVRDEFQSWYTANLDKLPIDGKLVPFAPSRGAVLGEREIQRLIADSRKNPLGVPRLGKDGEERIAVSFAPVIFQDIAAPYDQFGRVVWEGDRLTVDVREPLVYYYLAHAFLKGEPILQINYVIWYLERAGKRSPWIERAHLDGMTLRVSLDSQGCPFMVDVMNNCGCYHFFSPREDRLDRVVSKSLGLDPFVPQWLPEIAPGERLGIRVNSGWHQVERMLAVDVPSDSIPYELMPYEVLESLSREGNRRESMFDPKGIAKGSRRRKEEVLFFSMGVPSVGSMRQRGNHPIALVGRAHFDDPHLLENNFIFK
jgi:hypothetical protein